MKVKELKEILSKLPQDIDIRIGTSYNTSSKIQDIITGNKNTINKLKYIKHIIKILQKEIETRKEGIESLQYMDYYIRIIDDGYGVLQQYYANKESEWPFASYGWDYKPKKEKDIIKDLKTGIKNLEKELKEREKELKEIEKDETNNIIELLCYK